MHLRRTDYVARAVPAAFLILSLDSFWKGFGCDSPMLTVSNISKQFRGADAPILKNISFTVNAGERVGLIGPNGSGKSTLLHIIVGDIAADSGGIVLVPPDLRIGYLGQGVDPDSSALVQDVLYPNVAALRQAEADVERLAAQIGAS